jgi:hypothetical protein
MNGKGRKRDSDSSQDELPLWPFCYLLHTPHLLHAPQVFFFSPDQVRLLHRICHSPCPRQAAKSSGTDTEPLNLNHSTVLSSLPQGYGFSIWWNDTGGNELLGVKSGQASLTQQCMGVVCLT